MLDIWVSHTVSEEQEQTVEADIKKKQPTIIQNNNTAEAFNEY